MFCKCYTVYLKEQCEPLLLLTSIEGNIFLKMYKECIYEN